MTVMDPTNFLRDEKLNDAPQMGGIGEVVQIDKSLFRGKRKYNRGRLFRGNRNNATRASNNNNNNNRLEQCPSSTSSDDSDSSGDQTNNNRNYGTKIDGPWIFGIAQPMAEGYEARFSHVQRRDAAFCLIICLLTSLKGGNTKNQCKQLAQLNEYLIDNFNIDEQKILKDLLVKKSREKQHRSDLTRSLTTSSEPNTEMTTLFLLILLSFSLILN
ncbi:unnamed protein product [Didymodactylos carnosus]|uniref:Uncharacterized protein n=1 Tax=Didymodactylos carnosus TaxID=1234261 RepID=A0A815S361_9BILA|nr:unnamed protein product [Didymodactylos carnosus]CAF1484803.1 unnamed protein product [Didymodactylos carnosus]CAF4121633.1 unnamed protein product [Didymodactylos carnosus]CAF4349112.1 unnamed protein product [Didymodactylos carnosus]